MTRELSEGDVKLIKAIANGGFSVVYTGTTKEGEYVAVKKMSLYNPTCGYMCCPFLLATPMTSRMISRGGGGGLTNRQKNKIRIVTGKMTPKEALDEARLLKSLRDQPFFLKYLGNYFTNSGKTFCVITELCLCNLRTMLKSDVLKKGEDQITGKFPISVAFHFMLPVLKGLAHMHEQGIIHRDIKEENILIGLDGVPKICDLGLAVAFRQRKKKPVSISAETLIGTNWYMPPEIVRKERFNQTADTWSTAMMVLSLIRGGNPFNTYDNEKGVTLWDQHVVEFYRSGYSESEHKTLGSGQKEFFKLAGIDLYASTEENKGRNVKLWKLLKGTLREMLVVNYDQRPMPAQLFDESENLEIYMGLWSEYIENGEIIPCNQIDSENDKYRKFRKQFNKAVSFVDRIIEARVGPL